MIDDAVAFDKPAQDCQLLFGRECVHFRLLDGSVRQADNHDCEAMIPACRVMVSEPIEIRVSIGSCYLRLR